MSHIYQPVVLKVLLERDGWATTREIASAFLSRDESQIDYYVEITKRMPGRVLASHGLVKQEGEGFRLTLDPQDLLPSEIGGLRIRYYVMSTCATAPPTNRFRETAYRCGLC